MNDAWKSRDGIIEAFFDHVLDEVEQMQGFLVYTSKQMAAAVERATLTTSNAQGMLKRYEHVIAKATKGKHQGKSVG